MTQYMIHGDEVYARDFSSEKWKLLRVGENPQQFVADQKASDELFALGKRSDWQTLLRQTFPEAKLCNCGEAFHGCKYGCDWSRSKTKEAVAARILAAKASPALEGV